MAGSKGARCSGSDHILLSVPVGVLLAVPEVALSRAASVVVGRARAETLLLLVLADKEDLEDSGDEEQERGNDRHGKYGSVHAASVAWRDRVGEVLALSSAETIVAEALRFVGISVANAKRGVYGSGARGGTVAGQDSDGNEATDEEDVKDNGCKGEKADTTEAACEDHGSDGVHDSNAGDALNSLLPSGNALVAVGLYREEV